MSGNLTVVQNGGTWPWGTNCQDVEYRPITGQTSPWERYQMYNVTTNLPMWQHQGYSSANIAYDIQRNTSTDEWADDGSDYPSYFVISSSTSQPTGQTNVAGATYQATSTNKYLHMFIGSGANHYVGYLDVWTSFHSSSGGGATNVLPVVNSSGLITLSTTPNEVKNVTFQKIDKHEIRFKYHQDNFNGFDYSGYSNNSGPYTAHVQWFIRVRRAGAIVASMEAYCDNTKGYKTIVWNANGQQIVFGTSLINFDFQHNDEIEVLTGNSATINEVIEFGTIQSVSTLTVFRSFIYKAHDIVINVTKVKEGETAKFRITERNSALADHDRMVQIFKRNTPSASYSSMVLLDTKLFSQGTYVSVVDGTNYDYLDQDHFNSITVEKNVYYTIAHIQDLNGNDPHGRFYDHLDQKWIKPLGKVSSNFW